MPAPTTVTTTTKGEKTVVTTADDAAEVTVDIEGVISELKALYIQEHSKDPTAEMVEQWKLEVLKTAKEEGGDQNKEEN